MTPTEIMDHMMQGDAPLRDLMIAARKQRKAMGPLFVDLVTQLGFRSMREMETGEINALLPSLFLLGEWREPFAYRPVVRLLSRPSPIVEHLLGDQAIESGSYRILASVFDGHLTPLCDAACNPRADEYVRGTFMSALVLISLAHPQQRNEIENFFRKFRTLCPDAPDEVMINWMTSIAELGLEDMLESIQTAMQKEELPIYFGDFAAFEARLRETIDGNGVPVGDRYRKFLVSDAIEDLLQ
jgi:hypothetical protein